MISLDKLIYHPVPGSYKRRSTVDVSVGNVPMGGHHPIRLQSMTNTPTQNIQDTVNQCIRIINAGSDYVRITAPGVSDAKILGEIKAELKNRGYNSPLIADIHYSPRAAEIAAALIEKIRINPGNFADKKQWNQLKFSDEEYAAEISRIESRFVPLIEICKKKETAMRIGVNHGSLSDRIMSRYGDTPYGMAESAMEFLRICRKHAFSQVVVSMKASNTLIMVHANRILASMMDHEELFFPIHLGVTEAGEGEDGRLKSAIGIGALLVDGIGDTIRVSLTEPPENEIPVAKKIVVYSLKQAEISPIEFTNPNLVNPFEYFRRKTDLRGNVGGSQAPVVVASYPLKMNVNEALEKLGFAWNRSKRQWANRDHSPEFVFYPGEPPDVTLPENTSWIIPFESWKSIDKRPVNFLPLLQVSDYTSPSFEKIPGIYFIQATLNQIKKSLIEKMTNDTNCILVLDAEEEFGLAQQKIAFLEAMANACPVPIIIKRNYKISDSETFQIAAAIDTGSLFLDGLGDGLWINHYESRFASLCLSTAFGILQASRVRITKPEYISCPGCGRTLFDLEQTVARIKAKTSHLKGLKIGIMGCIVNGIGEMADADYGYVGAGPGKITLYKNKEVVKKNLPESEAVDALVHLIKENGDWKERKGE